MAKKRKNSTNVDQDAEEPKRIRRPSAAIAKSGLTPSQIRSTTLQLNLDRYPLSDTVAQEVERLSILGGRWRHLVGLFANFLASRKLSLTIIEDSPSGLQTFYNRNWAALEAVKTTNNTSSSPTQNHFWTILSVLLFQTASLLTCVSPSRGTWQLQPRGALWRTFFHV